MQKLRHDDLLKLKHLMWQTTSPGVAGSLVVTIGSEAVHAQTLSALERCSLMPFMINMIRDLYEGIRARERETEMPEIEARQSFEITGKRVGGYGKCNFKSPEIVSWWERNMQ